MAFHQREYERLRTWLEAANQVRPPGQTRRWRLTGGEDLGREPTRDDIERMAGPVLLEFGASWCGYCLALAPKLARLLEDHPAVRHIKIEDGSRRKLGRSFGVKFWPTLVFIRDGHVVKQVSRPALGEVREGLAAIAEGA